MIDRALNRIKDIIQALAKVFGKEAQHEIPVLLERGILATVAPVGLRVSQMLCAIQFDGQAQFLAKQICFHAASCVKRDGELCIQAKAVGSTWQRLEAAVEKRFARAPRPRDALSFGSQRATGMHKEICQGNVPWARPIPRTNQLTKSDADDTRL